MPKFKVIRIPYVEQIKAEWNPGYVAVKFDCGYIHAKTIVAAKQILKAGIESGKFPDDSILS